PPRYRRGSARGPGTADPLHSGEWCSRNSYTSDASTPGKDPVGSVARSVRGVATFGHSTSRQRLERCSGGRRQHTSSAWREIPRFAGSRPSHHFVTSSRWPRLTEGAPWLDCSTRAGPQKVPPPVSVYWK